MWRRRNWLARVLACGLALTAGGAWAQDAGQIGVIVMHGKGGAPDRLVGKLAQQLSARGLRVRSLEMPWSGRRGYDVGPDAAQAEVAQALADLQAQGATRLFLVGHSQGGLFALHLGAKLPVAGVVAIAPGGNVGASIYEEKLGAERARAKEMVDAGKGAETGTFADYEGRKGTSEVHARADVYWAWFDPQGVMNQQRALRALPPTLPVLYIAPTRDYPALRKANPKLFALLTPQPLTRFLEPDATHTEAPTAASQAIGDWLLEAAAPR